MPRWRVSAPPAPAARSREHMRLRRDEAGTAVIGTIFGFVAFLGFLLFAVNVAVGLYARSTATAIGFDETRRLSLAGAACSAQLEATRGVIIDRFDDWWRTVIVTAGCTDDIATVQVDASSSRSLVPPVLFRLTRLAEFHRTFRVRVEALR